MKSHVHNIDKMAYGNACIPSSTCARKGTTKIPLAKGTPQGNMKLFCAKMKVNTCTLYETGLSTEEEDDGEIVI